MPKGRSARQEPDEAVQRRLTELETRLSAVETALGARDPDAVRAGPCPDEPAPGIGAADPPDEPRDPPPVTPADLRRRHGRPGGVLLVSGVRLPRGGRVSWEREQPATTLLDLDWAVVADRAAALAHPVRLRLLREVLRGARSVAALACLPGVGSSGQLYHHLRPLLAEGWIRPCDRGRYEVPEHQVGPLLAVIAALTDPEA